MSVDVTVRALEVVARVTFTGPSARAHATIAATDWRDLLAPDAETPDVTIVVGPDAASTVPQSPVESLPQRLASRVTLDALRAMSGRAIMLHAAAIARVDGQVIGLVGPSGRGKTTAVEMLARSNAYVTDETLAIRSDGSIIPYPKPLLIGHHPGVKLARAASDLGLRPAGTTALRLGALVLLDRRDGHPEPTVSRVDPVDGLLQLARESSYLAQLDAPLQALGTLVEHTGGVRRISYTEASTLPDAVDQVLALHGDPLPPAEQPGAFCPAAGPGWVRTPYTDALAIDNRLIVMRGRKLTVLDGIGPAVWRAASGVSTADVVSSVVDRHPPPGNVRNPATKVASTLEDLTGAGLLRHT